MADLREPGSKGPATIGILASVTAAATLLATYFVTMSNGVLSSACEFVTMLAASVVIATAFAWLFAWDRDRERANART